MKVPRKGSHVTARKTKMYWKVGRGVSTYHLGPKFSSLHSLSFCQPIHLYAVVSKTSHLSHPVGFFSLSSHMPKPKLSQPQSKLFCPQMQIRLLYSIILGTVKSVLYNPMESYADISNQKDQNQHFQMRKKKQHSE